MKIPEKDKRSPQRVAFSLAAGAYDLLAAEALELNYDDPSDLARTVLELHLETVKVKPESLQTVRSLTESKEKEKRQQTRKKEKSKAETVHTS